MKLIKESYTPKEILDRSQDVAIAYQELRTALYVYETSVEEIENLKRNAKIATTELEELWDSSIKDIIADTEDTLLQKAEEEE